MTLNDCGTPAVVGEAKIEPVKGGEASSLKADVALIAIGRRPYIDGLGLENVGVKTERGEVVIDDGFRTSVEGVYAIGDVR